MSVKNNRVHVKPYDRVKNGKIEHVAYDTDGYERKQGLLDPNRLKLLEEQQRNKKNYDPDFQYFFGTSSKGTFPIVDSHDERDQLGVCVNLYKFNSSLLKNLEKLEELGLDVFVDNGSFERFDLMLKNKITPAEYLDEINCYKYFEEITKNYETLLRKSKKPKDIVITVPEVIGSSELTQKLQKRYLDSYKELEKKYGCKLIVALQFNPNSDNWYEDLEQGASFISENIPKNWLVGIPFGNDFRIIQKKENFDKIDKLFDSKLEGYEAHLFGCGSPTKLEKFAIPNDDFVYSVDASSVMNWSKNSHYFGDGRVIDVRYLTGKTGTPETIEKKRGEFEKHSGIPYQRWILSGRTNPKEAINYLKKFDINTSNFTSYYNL